MFSKIRRPVLQFSGDWSKDMLHLVRELERYDGALEKPGALAISEAEIYASQGVAFPATQISSSDANTLDDYEEGTWTPTDGSGAGLVLTVTSARYTKIGRAVIGQCHVTYPATADGTASLIAGFPFTTSGIHTGSLYTSGAGGGTTIQVSGTNINLYAPGAVAITNANLSGAFVIVGFCINT
jgi:hypothetical protein